jgi:uncharacterized phage protein gp47/JayE
MATTIEQLKIKTVAEIRDGMLSDYANMLRTRGIANPNVSEGTAEYCDATATAQGIYAASLAIPELANAQMADSAQGDDLIRFAAIYKLALRAAGPSAGPLVLSSTVSGSIAIPGGAGLIDPNGLAYVVVTGGSYASGANIPIASTDTGAATNLIAGTVLRWVSPPPFANTTALVGTGGLTGGIDAEDIEGLRSRVLERLQNPPNGTNWSSIVAATEASSTAVQKAFAYPACNGPSTVHVCAARSPTATNKGRDIDPTVLAGTVIPAVAAAFPEFIDIKVTGAQNTPTSVSIGLALPLSTKAVPAGPGGGWVDAQPFPYVDSLGYAGAVLIDHSSAFTVASDLPAAVGSTICWLSTDDWQLRTAKVVTCSSGASPYYITIDTAFVSNNGVLIAPGDFVFPYAERMAVYVKAVLDGFAKLGPGEKTDSISLLPRANRRPLPSQSWPASLQSLFLRGLTDAGEEVADVQYRYRSTTTPSLPTLITDGPRILTPAQIGLYPLT